MVQLVQFIFVYTAVSLLYYGLHSNAGIIALLAAVQ